MENLTESQIKENSFIMIELKTGEKKPYLVFKKRTGNITGAIMLLGYLSEELLKKANQLLPFEDRGVSDRYYIAAEGKPGTDKRVLGYRHLTKDEAKEMKEALRNAGGSLLNYIDLI